MRCENCGKNEANFPLVSDIALSHGHCHTLAFLLVVGEQFVIPILERGEFSGHSDVPFPQQFAGDPAGSVVSSFVIVQAQGDVLQLGLRFQ